MVGRFSKSSKEICPGKGVFIVESSPGHKPAERR